MAASVWDEPHCTPATTSLQLREELSLTGGRVAVMVGGKLAVTVFGWGRGVAAVGGRAGGEEVEGEGVGAVRS